MVEITEQTAYQRCIDLLSRREHSQVELRRKMQHSGVDDQLIEVVLTRLQTDNYQSDERFAEVFTRSRVARKYGAKKITYELKQKGIENHLVNQEIIKYNDDFLENAQQLIRRKAPRGDISAIFSDIKLKDKITRSLVSKGYDFDVIRLAFEILQEENHD